MNSARSCTVFHVPSSSAKGHSALILNANLALLIRLPGTQEWVATPWLWQPPGCSWAEWAPPRHKHLVHSIHFFLGPQFSAGKRMWNLDIRTSLVKSPAAVVDVFGCFNPHRHCCGWLNHIWLVVYLPLWKMMDESQLGWLFHSQLNGKS